MSKFSADSRMASGKGTSNNYAYLVVDDKTRDAVIIDPANPPEYDDLYNLQARRLTQCTESSQS